MRTAIFAGFVAIILGAVDATAALKVGLVLDKGGRDDKSFNAAADRGASKAKKQLGIELKVMESSDDASLGANLRNFAKRGFELVIGIGFIQEDPLNKVAREFPKTKFLLVDGKSDLPNVRSVMFNEHEGSFVVGAIAALVSKTNVIGFIGGMDIPLIRRFALGYKKGAEAVKPTTKVITHFVGSSSDAWRNPTRAKELALNQFRQQQVDIIFAAAGASSMGVFDAAEEVKRFAIGCDSNQNWIKPGRILTSMIKGVDVAVYDAIEKTQLNKFEGGVFSVGIKEGAIDFSVDSYNRAILPADVEKKANEIKARIVSGQIKVPDYYKVGENG